MSTSRCYSLPLTLSGSCDIKYHLIRCNGHRESSDISSFWLNRNGVIGLNHECNDSDCCPLFYGRVLAITSRCGHHSRPYLSTHMLGNYNDLGCNCAGGGPECDCSSSDDDHDDNCHSDRSEKSRKIEHKDHENTKKEKKMRKKRDKKHKKDRKHKHDRSHDHDKKHEHERDREREHEGDHERDRDGRDRNGRECERKYERCSCKNNIDCSFCSCGNTNRTIYGSGSGWEYIDAYGYR